MNLGLNNDLREPSIIFVVMFVARQGLSKMPSKPGPVIGQAHEVGATWLPGSVFHVSHRLRRHLKTLN